MSELISLEQKALQNMNIKFGQREVCNVVLKPLKQKKIGNKIFKKDEPIFIFDTLKSGNLEVNSSQVYASGGRGNAKMIVWDNEKVVTWTMEDALISPMTYAILYNADITEDIVNYHVGIKTKGVRKNNVWTLDYNSDKIIDPVVYDYNNNKIGANLNTMFDVKTHGYLTITNRNSIEKIWNGKDIIYLSPRSNWNVKDVIDIYYGNNNQQNKLYNNDYQLVNNEYIDFTNMCLSNYYSNITSNLNGILRRFTIQVPNASNNMHVSNYTYTWIYDSNAPTNGKEYISFVEPWDETIFHNDEFWLDCYEKRKGSKIVITNKELSDYYKVEAEMLWKKSDDGQDVIVHLTIPCAKIDFNNDFIFSSSQEPQVFKFNMNIIPTLIEKTKVLFTYNIETTE